MIKKILTLSTLVLSMSVMAQTAPMNMQNSQNLPTVENSNGYLTDSSGKVVRSGFSLCWRTSSYDPAYTYMMECDGYRTPPAVVRAPDAPPPVVQEQGVEPRPQPVVQNEVKTVILFAFDSSRISGEERVKLDSIINPNTRYQLTVTGHADPIGSDQYNRKLSERRAQAVYKYLRDNGVPSENIELFAAGETRPVVECENTATRANIACNAPNRRVEIITK